MTLSDQLLQQILDSVHAHTIVIYRNRIIIANDLVQRWSGMPVEKTRKLSIRDIIHPESRVTALKVLKSLFQDEPKVAARLRIQHPVRGSLWMDVTITRPDYLSDKNYFLVSFSPGDQLPDDQHSSKNIQLDMISEETSIERHQLLTEIISEENLVNTSLENFLTTLHDIIPYVSTSIALVDGNLIRFIAARGFRPDVTLDDLELTVDQVMSRSTGILYENSSGKVQMIEDTHNHPGWVQSPVVEHIRSWMGVELRYENKLLGILNIDAGSPGYFTKDHARHALALSAQAVNALVFTRLYQQFYYDYEERKRLQQILVRNLISTETMYAVQELLFASDDPGSILPGMIDIISSSMDDTEIIVIIFQPATGKLMHRLQSSKIDIDAWQVFKEISGQAEQLTSSMPSGDLHYPNTTIRLESGQDAIAAVIRKRGALIAVREPGGQAFDEADHELVTTIANQLSLALENEMLYSQLTRHSQHLERLVERRTSQLSVERKRLKAILDSTAEGIFYMENFKIQYANPAFCRMVGYELEELYSKPLSFIRVMMDNGSDHNFNSLLDNPMEVVPGKSETRLRHHDETEFYASIRFSLVGQPGEDPVRMVAIARDISQERKLYVQRARFIANAAHELRTPLSSLILRLHMLRRQPERIDAHVESLDKITDYLKELVEELLTLSRFERGSIILEKHEFILQELIKQAIDEHQLFADEQEVTLHLKMPDDPIEILVDGKRILQATGNLVLNAINYSSKNGRVDIMVNVEADTVGNQNVIIHVIDEGSGIESDLLPDDIFEPFARPSGGSRKETGMGLALVREITSLHGGSIHAKNKTDGGASFRMMLPLN